MSRVLFVVKEMKMEHLGIMYLTDALERAGHEVALARCDRGRTPKDLVAAFMPEFVCYSVCSGLEDFYLDMDQSLFETATVKFASVFGGPSVTFAPSDVYHTETPYNQRICVRGEGEHAIVQVVNQGYWDGHLDLTRIETATIPNREVMYLFDDLRDNPIKNIITRRGCKYACSYCFNREWNKLYKGMLPRGVVRYRPVNSVIEEALEIKSRWPVKMINFVDDNFVSSSDWLHEFADKWPGAVGLPFFCSVRPDDVTLLKMSLLKKAGCAIANMALESANAETRRSVLTRTSDSKKVIVAIDLARDMGIRTRLQNIIGLPMENPLKDALETLDFNIKVRPTSSWCALMQTYKGTEIHRIAERGGYIDESNDVTDQEFFGHSTLLIKDRRKIERLHKLWPLLTTYRWLRPLTWLLIRMPLPYSWYRRFFNWTKRLLAERDLWRVFK